MEEERSSEKKVQISERTTLKKFKSNEIKQFQKISKILAFLTINFNLVSADPKDILAYKAQESKLKCYH